MSGLEHDDLRHALTLAQRHGFRTVRLRHGDDRFRAVFGETCAAEEDFSDIDEPTSLVAPEPESAEIEVGSPYVGYFREVKTPTVAGQSVEAGQVVGEIVALGIANDVAVPADGEVVEVLVAAGDAVEFGQPLFKVKKT